MYAWLRLFVSMYSVLISYDLLNGIQEATYLNILVICYEPLLLWLDILEWEKLIHLKRGKGKEKELLIFLRRDNIVA